MRRVTELRVLDVLRARSEELAAIVGHADHGGVDVEHVDDRLRQRLERLVERELLRKRAGDLVQRTEPARRVPLGGERGLTLVAEVRGLLVELRVLHRDRELPCKRTEQLRLVVRRTAAEDRVHRQQADHLAANEERDRERRLDPGLARRIPHGPQAAIARNVIRVDERGAPPVRARAAAPRRARAGR